MSAKRSKRDDSDDKSGSTAEESTADRLTRMESQLANLMKLLTERIEAAPAGVLVPAARHLPRNRRTKPIKENAPEPVESSRVHPDLQDVPEPRRQRKQRQMAPRRVYRAVQIKDPKMFTHLRTITPAGSAIVVYLTQHGQATVPELVANLDLKRKTVENLLSQLNQLGLIESTAK